MHHQRQHDGTLWIEGTASNARFTHADGTVYGGVARAPEVGSFVLAFQALRQMGFGETETRRALESVRSHVGRSGSAEDVVRAGLRALTDGGAGALSVA